MLQLVDQTLHQMPFAIDKTVVLPRLLAVGTRGNDRDGRSSGNELQEIGGIIPLISNDISATPIAQQRNGLGEVVTMAAGQQNTQRIAQGINQDMNLGRESTTTTPQGLRGLTTVFFSPPPRYNEHARWCYRASRSPYRGQRQSVRAIHPRRLARTSGRSACRPYSSSHIHSARAATEHHSALSTRHLPGNDDSLLPDPRKRACAAARSERSFAIGHREMLSLSSRDYLSNVNTT